MEHRRGHGGVWGDDVHESVGWGVGVAGLYYG